MVRSLHIVLRLVVISVILAGPDIAEACSCAIDGSIGAAVRRAGLIFVGTVIRVERPQLSPPINSDGSGTGQGTRSKTATATLTTARVFHGPVAQQIQITGGVCDVVFQPGETWLVYAHAREGRIGADNCSRTRRQAEASQDLLYLEAWEQGRPVGVVYGDATRRVVDTNGNVQVASLSDVQVVALSGGRRFEVPIGAWGQYELVLPPGDFQIWLERAGQVLSPIETGRINQGEDRRVALVSVYD
jgi:hypothetical protein